MPQITVDHSASLDDAFDGPGFARALHPLVAATVDTRIEGCKTRLRRVEGTVVGDGTGDDALIHVGIALLPGRGDELKARLTESVVALVGDFVEPGVTVHVSAEVRDLEASYRKR
ncbi:5-carboxymethyl-2-hydroxymuconate Delta-isomerase [Streptomyces sp. SP18CS02]|uniref:5-carboxymethyl-2-hydroxymuconate Delta-isomerase n=1 Tax=Streptomyces sp. SP18CS02 TaxID=3002531 RepID=UPI002E78ECCF|nr:isomerase [Streptomyces sp. SP18CS02]MEE1755205.1 isomerase [Streptomyces sp. SP18CS02]